MTSRIGQPDTDADRKLRACLDRPQLSSFVVVAGAGSGKTTSLVKALDHIVQTRGADLRRRGQQIACVTYTEVAVGEIWGDVGNAPLFHVSTIHSFLWSLIRPFQTDLREWISVRIDEKLTEAREKLAKPRTQAKTREKLTGKIERYLAQRTALAGARYVTYGTGSDYAKGILGHEDVLRVGPMLIASRPLLRNLIASRFPFIFVDESQDTNPSFVASLREIIVTAKDRFCLGFFGDPMQKIYLGGAGAISLGEGSSEITKPENFRCPASVLRVINRIRAEDDGLQQTRGRTTDQNGVSVSVEGSARLFLLLADHRRSERLAEVRRWLSHSNGDLLWESDENVRVLVLVHSMAARRLGFSDVCTALYNGAPASLKTGFRDGSSWALRPFLTFLLPLVLASRAGDQFDVLASLRKNCPLLTPERLEGQNVAELLKRLSTDVETLTAMLGETSTHTVRDVLTFVRDRELSGLDEKFNHALSNVAGVDDDDDEGSEDEAMTAFFACPASQLWGYRSYIEDHSPFATHQGVKGAEFERVLVVLDDEEGDYNLFSYGKYFGITALSDKDEENISKGIDSVISRTRRLFYVCCSRAMRDLAVVMFVPDVNEAHATIISRNIFDAADIHVFDA